MLALEAGGMFVGGGRGGEGALYFRYRYSEQTALEEVINISSYLITAPVSSEGRRGRARPFPRVHCSHAENGSGRAMGWLLIRQNLASPGEPGKITDTHRTLEAKRQNRRQSTDKMAAFPLTIITSSRKRFGKVSVVKWMKRRRK